MKNILLIILFSLVIVNHGFSQDDSLINEIDRKVQKWKPIIEKELDSCTVYYKYAWGDNYQFAKWFDEEQDNDSLTIATSVSVLDKNDLGYFVSEFYCSFQDNCCINVNYYYNEDKQLYYAFLTLNTDQAELPVSVEKRFYFNKTGDTIRKTESVYKMDTKEKIDIEYMDKEVDFKLNLRDMDFYEIWESR